MTVTDRPTKRSPCYCVQKKAEGAWGTLKGGIGGGVKESFLEEVVAEVNLQR